MCQQPIGCSPKGIKSKGRRKVPLCFFGGSSVLPFTLDVVFQLPTQLISHWYRSFGLLIHSVGNFLQLASQDITTQYFSGILTCIFHIYNLFSLNNGTNSKPLRFDFSPPPFSLCADFVTIKSLANLYSDEVNFLCSPELIMSSATTASCLYGKIITPCMLMPHVCLKGTPVAEMNSSGLLKVSEAHLSLIYCPSFRLGRSLTGIKARLISFLVDDFMLK